jgi:hypothetical protein
MTQVEDGSSSPLTSAVTAAAAAVGRVVGGGRHISRSARSLTGARGLAAFRQHQA